MKLKLFNSLHKKIAIVFTSLIVVLLLIFSAFTYSFDSKAIYNQVSQANALTISQMGSNFDTQLNLMEKASRQLASEPFLIDILKNYSFKDETLVSRLQQDISNIFSYTKISWTEIDNLHFYDLEGNKLSQKISEVYIPNPKIKDYQNSETKIEYGILLNNSTGLENTVVSYLRLIKDPETSNPLGWIRLDLNMYKMEFVQKIQNDSRTFIVLRPNGRVIYTNKPKQIDIIEITKLLKTIKYQGSFVFLNNNEKKLINYYKSNKSNWLIASIVPQHQLNQGLREVRTFTFTLVSVSILISILSAIFISRKITLPLKKLHLTMKDIENGDLKTRVHITSNDEIGELGKQMNTMIDSIDSLIHQVFQVEIKHREAQIKALSAQINPHFLYNTLETVDILSLKGKKEEVQMIVLSLSKMMRYAFKKEAIVSFKEELEHLEAFLKIQKVKYAQRININIQVPQVLFSARIPKLTLQPIVENAFKHGFFKKNGINNLIISAEHSHKKMYIYIEDDGAGVPADRIDQLNFWLTNMEHGQDVKHVGLINVNERIKYSFGEEYGLKASSEEGFGFKIIVSLPLNKIE